MKGLGSAIFPLKKKVSREIVSASQHGLNPRNYSTGRLLRCSAFQKIGSTKAAAKPNAAMSSFHPNLPWADCLLWIHWGDPAGAPPLML